MDSTPGMYLVWPAQVGLLPPQPKQRSKRAAIKQPRRKTEEVHQSNETTGLRNEHDDRNEGLQI